MTVTEILKNFHGLLTASVPFLLRAGVIAGDDEWDDFFEMAFAVAVDRPLEEHHGRRTGWKYGTWHAAAGNMAQVYVSVRGASPVLVGRAQAAGGAPAIRYEEQQGTSPPIRFGFREFANPLMEQGAREGMSYVLGEVVDDRQPLPAGARVCVPLDACEFDVA